MNERTISLEEARERAKAWTWTTQRIIDQLPTLDLYDHKFIARCQKIRDELIPALTQAMTEQISLARLNASLLLLHLGESGGTDGIIACLHEPDQNMLDATLIALSLMPINPPVPLKAEPLFVELLNIAKSDSAQEVRALEVIMRSDLPGTDSLVLGLLKHSSADVCIGAMKWLARHDQDSGAFGVAQDFLLGPGSSFHNRYWVIQALQDYCNSQNLELSSKAAGLLSRFVRSRLEYSDNDSANLVSNALTEISHAGFPEEKQLLEAVLESSTQRWAKTQALKRLAQLDGTNAIVRLAQNLENSDLRSSAAASLAKVARGTNDPQLIELLTTLVQKETRQDVLGTLVGALVAVAGEAALHSLTQIFSQLSPYRLMQVHWLVDHITPEIAIERLVQAGFIPLPDKALLQVIQDDWKKDPDPQDVFWDLLMPTRRLVWFDPNVRYGPANYVDLIGDFVEISKGGFSADSISQEIDDDWVVEVVFVYKEKVYSFRAKDAGGWFDTAQLLQTVNKALEEAGQNEQFIQLYGPGDRTCTVAFGPATAFRQVARELYFPLKEDVEEKIITHAVLAYYRPKPLTATS